MSLVYIPETTVSLSKVGNVWYGAVQDNGQCYIEICELLDALGYDPEAVEFPVKVVVNGKTYRKTMLYYTANNGGNFDILATDDGFALSVTEGSVSAISTKSMTSITFAVYPDLEINDDWETIVASGGSGYMVGSWKMLDIGTVNGIACGSVRMCKVAEDEDGSVSTWLALDSLKTYMNMNSTDSNDGGWEKCERRAWLNGAFLNGLPEAVRKAIVPTTRYSYSYDATSEGYTNNVETKDHVWIPSVAEICLTNPGYTQETKGPYYAAIDFHISDRILTLGYEGTKYRWWNRTVSATNKGKQFRGTAATGGAPGTGALATAMGGIVIGFSLAIPEEPDEEATNDISYGEYQASPKYRMGNPFRGIIGWKWVQKYLGVGK